jgi:transposase
MHAPTTNDLKNLPADPAVLMSMVMAQAAENAQLQATVASLRREKDEIARLFSEQLAKCQSQIDWLQRQVFGRKSEKIDPNQMWLDQLTIQAVEKNPPAADVATPVVETKVAEHTRRHTPHGRGELPAHLPRETEVLDLTEAEKIMPDGTPRPLIGHEDTERVAYEPGRIFVKVTRRLKYGSSMGQEENGVAIAPVPASIVERCLADESLLAHVVVSKYVDHQPLNRLEHILARSGIEMTRQTMCGWTMACGEAVQPLVDAIITETFAAKLVHNDDTPVDMQDYKSGKPRGARMRETRLWVTTVSPREGPWTVFDFTSGRSTDGPRKFFAKYAGRIVCDAYKSYETLGNERDDLIFIGCWAHVRRYFLKAHRGGYPREGVEFVAMIRELYQVEASLVDTVLPPEATPAQRAEVRDKDNARRVEARQSLALPVLTRIRTRLDELIPGTPPKDDLGKALNYAHKIWDRLTEYTKDGSLPIDNNPVEQMIRPVALGRNNWLYFGSERGGRAAANLMSLVATCKRAKVEPFAYLRDVFRRLPAAKTPAQVRALLPDVWKPA